MKMKQIYNQIITYFYDKRLNQILLVYLFIQPIIDVTVAFSIRYENIINIGIILRGIFFLYCFFFLIFVNKKEKYFKISSILILGYISLNLILTYVNKTEIAAVYRTISYLFKIFYLPIVAMFLYNIRKVFKEKNLCVNYFLYVSILIISYILNIGYQTYLIQDNKQGFIGVFNSANEISAILVGLFPIVLDYLYKNKHKYIAFLCILLGICASFFIGTKIVFFGILGIIVLYGYYIICQKTKECKYKVIYRLVPVIVLFILVTIFCITILPKTNIYKNYKQTISYFEIDETLDNLLNLDTIDKIVFSGRLKFLEKNMEIYQDSNTTQKMIGNNTIDKYEKLIEIDYFDILFITGIIGFLVFIIPIIYILVMIFKQKENRKKIGIISIFIFLGISLFSGHVFTAPSVSIYLALLPNLLKDGEDNLKVNVNEQ